jgi:dienelactone hydrolase
LRKFKTPIHLVFLLALSFLLSTYSQPTEQVTKITPRPLESIQDIMAWKNIRSPVVSNNGQWFAYYLSPNEGDGEVIIRQIKGDKVYRFPIGQSSRYQIPGRLAFSSDSQWLAYSISPSQKEAKKLRRQKKKLYHKIGLVNLPTGKKIEFEKIKNFSFSGKNPGWLALHKYPPESQSKEKEKWSGSDLILYDLAAGTELNIGNVGEFAFDKQGHWLAWIIDAKDKTGNGVQIRCLKTGRVIVLDSDEAIYKKLTWAEEKEALAVLKGKEDKNYQEPLYSLLAFTHLDQSPPEKIIYDPLEDKTFPQNMTLSPHRAPRWNNDLTALFVGFHEVERKEEDKSPANKETSSQDKPKEKKKSPSNSLPSAGKLTDEDLPDLVIWHWLDSRLQSRQQVQEKQDKEFSYLGVYWIKDKKFIRLADEKLRRVEPTPKYRWGVGFDNRPYELMGNLDGRRYQDIYVVDLKTGQRRLALKKCRWYFGVSPEGTHILYYQDGHFYTYNLASGQSKNITQQVPTSFINTEDDHNVIKPPIRPFGWVKGGRAVLLSDNWDVWLVPISKGKAVNLTVNGKTKGIRYRRRFRLDPEEKGIDLSQPVYFSAYGEWTKMGGIVRINKDKPPAKLLLWDKAIFSGLLKAKNKDVYLYTKQTYKDYPDYYVADSDLKNGRRITEANPQQKEFLWSSGSILIDYQSEKGDKLQAALFLPANYEKGKTYPTIVYIYEKLSQNFNRYFTPYANGFNKSVYTSRGYAVLMPDIVYQINDPGMSAVWCVLPAIKAAIATGVVDKSRIGLHGHSWGGYQTAFLITQTKIFKAAVAGAPLTNMVSMYSSIYWNTGSANQPIFESSQGRFRGGYWDYQEAYLRNSPVFHAKNVQTPLLILHNDKDGAVVWNQGIEYYNTLRRLQKPVIMLQYKGENHGLSKLPNQKDYTVRMMEFFDHYLRGKPAPTWLKEGIPHLKLKKHLQERTKKIMLEGRKKKEKQKEMSK